MLRQQPAACATLWLCVPLRCLVLSYRASAASPVRHAIVRLTDGQWVVTLHDLPHLPATAEDITAADGQRTHGAAATSLAALIHSYTARCAAESVDAASDDTAAAAPTVSPKLVGVLTRADVDVALAARASKAAAAGKLREPERAQRGWAAKLMSTKVARETRDVGDASSSEDDGEALAARGAVAAPPSAAGAAAAAVVEEGRRPRRRSRSVASGKGAESEEDTTTTPAAAAALAAARHALEEQAAEQTARALAELARHHQGLQSRVSAIALSKPAGGAHKGGFGTLSKKSMGASGEAASDSKAEPASGGTPARTLQAEGLEERVSPAEAQRLADEARMHGRRPASGSTSSRAGSSGSSGGVLGRIAGAAASAVSRLGSLFDRPAPASNSAGTSRASDGAAARRSLTETSRPAATASSSSSAAGSWSQTRKPQLHDTRSKDGRTSPRGGASATSARFRSSAGSASSGSLSKAPMPAQATKTPQAPSHKGPPTRGGSLSASSLSSSGEGGPGSSKVPAASCRRRRRRSR